ncbi:hypothetical protein BLOT_010904 [Blomia tropicalis]|nr:hypothetical protein BLOT_010904 [Blomia tropicalis]
MISPIVDLENLNACLQISQQPFIFVFSKKFASMQIGSTQYSQNKGIKCSKLNFTLLSLKWKESAKKVFSHCSRSRGLFYRMKV